jgi:uncharacterized protein YeaO (DUF488 family)
MASAGSPSIRAVRVYELREGDRGARWLVDRRWPRGVRRGSLQLAGWARDAAPSDELRRWFGHDPSRWDEFRRRYVDELDAAPAAWHPLLDAAREGDLILLYAARDRERNNAVVLRDYLRSRLALTGPDEGEIRLLTLRVSCGELHPAPRQHSNGPAQVRAGQQARSLGVAR